MKLSTEHNAVLNAETVYLKNVHSVKNYKHSVIKKSTNKKLGKKIAKGAWSGLPMYTLTLVERRTCTDLCEHWLTCYGNNMPFAHRFDADEHLIPRLYLELNALDIKHPNGYVIRLHILGDFYSVAYVKFWQKQLANRPALKIYGYSRHHPPGTIGKEIAKTIKLFPNTFKVRFSNMPNNKFSANSEDITTQGIICPVQLDKTANCGTCGLCWTVNKPIIFKTH